MWRAGFIVKTRADADTREARGNNPARRDAAFASGAQIMTTNFLMPDKKIGPYQVNLAEAVTIGAMRRQASRPAMLQLERRGRRADRGGGGGALNSSYVDSLQPARLTARASARQGSTSQ